MPASYAARRDRPTSIIGPCLGMSSQCRTRPLLSAVVSVQAWFAQDETTIRPGSTTSLSLSIENLGEHTEAYTIIPAGMTAAWTTVTRPNVTLFGGSHDVVEIVIRPPAIHTTTAGPTPASVRVIPQQQPDEAIVAETLLDVQSFDDRRITMLQPLRRGRRARHVRVHGREPWQQPGELPAAPGRPHRACRRVVRPARGRRRVRFAEPRPSPAEGRAAASSGGANANSTSRSRRPSRITIRRSGMPR